MCMLLSSKNNIHSKNDLVLLQFHGKIENKKIKEKKTESMYLRTEKHFNSEILKKPNKNIIL